MLEFFLPLLGLALLDSINPSALAVTVYLLTQKHFVSRVLIYIVGIFLAYLALGVLLMLGLNALLNNVQNALASPWAYGVQGVLGLAMFCYGCFAPSKKEQKDTTRMPHSLHPAAIFVLGLSVTVIEFPTAFPYLGALGILSNAHLQSWQWFGILVVYNLIFILPPFLLLVIYSYLGPRLQVYIEKYRARLQKSSRVTGLTLLAIIGFYLTADSLRYFNFFGLLSLFLYRFSLSGSE